MERSEYHEDTAHLTKTALTVFVESSEEYYGQFVAKTMPRKKPTKQMVAGLVLHSVFLEKKSIDSLVGIYPDKCLNKNLGLIGANAKKHREANPGVYWMKEQERDAIRATYARLKDTVIGQAVEMCSQFEHEWKANLYGKDCKCRSDIAGDMGSHWIVYDLKFVENIRKFRKSSRDLKYWLQDGHYSPIIRHNVGKPVLFKFIAAETALPCRVRIHSYNEIKREAIAKFHKSKILDLLARERSGDWSDKYEEDLPLTEYDLEGAGDVLFEDEDIDALNEPVEDHEEVEMPF